MESLMDWIHYIPHTDRVRTEPMQVLAVGLSRSGTDSLKEALIQLGYNTYHGYDINKPGASRLWVELAMRKWAGSRDGEANITEKDFDRILGDRTAVTDMPCAGFAPEMIKAYPNAKVILNARKDLDAWFRSNLATFGMINAEKGRYIKSFFDPDLYWIRRCFESFFYKYFFDSFETTAKWRNREHSALVKGLVPKESLLEWSVEDGWGPLCTFLGKEVPSVPFPNGNAPAAFLKKSMQIHQEQNRRAVRSMVIFGSVVCGFVAALVKLCAL